jgi:hypothetical protein
LHRNNTAYCATRWLVWWNENICSACGQPRLASRTSRVAAPRDWPWSLYVPSTVIKIKINMAPIRTTHTVLHMPSLGTIHYTWAFRHSRYSQRAGPGAAFFANIQRPPILRPPPRTALMLLFFSRLIQSVVYKFCIECPQPSSPGLSIAWSPYFLGLVASPIFADLPTRHVPTTRPSQSVITTHGTLTVLDQGTPISD